MVLHQAAGETECRESGLSMDFLRSIPVLILAPFFYFGVGLPWSMLGKRIAWAPLWGVAVMGFSAELGCIAGAPVASAILIVALVHIAIGGWLLGRDEENRRLLGEELAGFLTMYLMALIPFVAAPFSTPGLWGGDWFVALESATHVWHRIPFTPELLARPPLFGAASIPLLLAGPLVPAFQIFCAVASACALQLFRTGLKQPARRGVIWILAASLFFLQVTLNAWPKFLSAAFLFAAWQILEAPSAGRTAVAGAFLGLAVASHQSAVLFAPLLLVRLLASPQPGATRIWQLMALGMMAAAVVAPWELHTGLAYGWAAKIHANPAVSQRIDSMPGWLNAVLVGVGTFAAWGPFYVLYHWLSSPDRLALARIAHEAYWLITSTFNSLAASLLGLILPWWVTLGGGKLWRRFRDFWSGLGWPVYTALLIALAGQMCLNPYFSTDGSLHTGWVPAGLALALWFADTPGNAPVGEIGAVLKWTLLLGTIPWVVFNIALTVALVLSAKFRNLFFDSDLQLLEKNGWTTLAMGGFPWVQGLAAGVGLLAWKLPRRSLA
jgi:hypothetical protein